MGAGRKVSHGWILLTFSKTMALHPKHTGNLNPSILAGSGLHYSVAKAQEKSGDGLQFDGSLAEESQVDLPLNTGSSLFGIPETCVRDRSPMLRDFRSCPAMAS